MKKLFDTNKSSTKATKKKVTKKATKSVKPKVHLAVGENLDVQFTSTGDALVDLVGKGADTLLQKKSKEDVTRFLRLVKSAYKQDPELTIKIARYFRDRQKGQGLKEQPLLLLAALDGNLDKKQIKEVLMVHSTNKEGAIPFNKIDFLDLVRIMAWHKYIHGAKAKMSYALCITMAEVINKSDNALEQVLRYKSRDLQYDVDNEVQVGIIDILGIVKNFDGPNVKLPDDVRDEYDQHLYPRYRGKIYGVDAVNAMAKEQRAYFKGELAKGYVPEGITFEKVLARGDTAGVKKMLLDGRISTAQFKINLNTILETLSVPQVEALYEKHKFNLFPHEILAMGKAFKFGTEHTKKNANGVRFVDQLLTESILAYKQRIKKKVLVLGDTSGSMSGALSKMSSVSQGDFASFMSYYASQVSGTYVYGTFDSTARLYEMKKSPSMEDYFKAHRESDCGTDFVAAIKAVANYFAKRKDIAPQVIAVISDMQFNAVIGSYSMRSTLSSGRAGTISEAVSYYKSKIGFEPELAYWNVNANTTPELAQDGVICISGFSANTCDMLFGVTENSREERRKINPQDVIKEINKNYI